MSGKTEKESQDKRAAYAVAIVAVRDDNESFLVANAVVAISEEDARLKGHELAAEMYPKSAGYIQYFVNVCCLHSIDVIRELYIEVEDDAVLSAEMIS